MGSPDAAGGIPQAGRPHWLTSVLVVAALLFVVVGFLLRGRLPDDDDALGAALLAFGSLWTVASVLAARDDGFVRMLARWQVSEPRVAERMRLDRLVLWSTCVPLGVVLVALGLLSIADGLGPDVG
jgi:hypothetical protein